MLKGRIRIEGWNVVDAELTIKSPNWNKNTSFVTTVTSLNPLKLSELHNCFNFITLARNEINRIEKNEWENSYLLYAVIKEQFFWKFFLFLPTNLNSTSKNFLII